MMEAHIVLWILLVRGLVRADKEELRRFNQPIDRLWAQSERAKCNQKAFLRVVIVFKQ